MLKLELLRNATFSNNDIRDAGDEKSILVDNYFPGYFATLGTFQFIKVRRVEDFADVVEYQPHRIINSAWYSAYSVPMFPVFALDAGDKDNSKEVPLFLEENNLKEKVFVFCKFTIHRARKLPDCAESFLREIKDKISDEFGNDIADADKGLIIDVYGGMGSADIIVVAACKDIRTLLEVCPRVRNITILNSDKKEIRAFNSSSSFFAVHSTISYDGLVSMFKGATIDVEVRYSLTNLLPQTLSDLFAIYNGLFRKDGTVITEPSREIIFGEYDVCVSLRIDESQLEKLLYIWGLRSSGEDFKGCDEEFKNYLACLDKFCAENVRAVYRSIQKISSENIGQYTVSEEDKTFNVNNYLKSQPQVRPPHKTYSSQISELMTINREIYHKIPASCRRDLRFIIDKCSTMLRSYTRFPLGLRIYNILINMVDVIKSNPDAFDGDDIVNAFGDLSSSLNTILMANNLSVDKIDNFPADTINSTGKIFFGLENSIRRIHEALNEESDGTRKPFYFIVLNPLKWIQTKQYLTTATPSNGSFAYSITLPDIDYLNLDKPYAYILMHELAHYLRLGKSSNYVQASAEHYRSATVFELILQHLVRSVRAKIKHLTISSELDRLFTRVIYVLLDESAKEFEFNWASRHHDFKIQYLYFMQEYLVNTIEDSLPHIFNEVAKAPLFRKTAETIKKELKDSIFTEIRNAFQFEAEEKRVEGMSNKIEDAVKESRADIIMCALAGLDFKKYINVQFNYMFEHMMTNATKGLDDVYLLRVTSVMAALGANAEKLRNYAYTVSDSESHFLMNAAEYLNRHHSMVNTLASYLRERHKTAKNKLERVTSPNNVNLLYEILQLFGYRREGDEKKPLAASYLARILYGEWYSALRYWMSDGVTGKKTKGHGEEDNHEE